VSSYKLISRQNKKTQKLINSISCVKYKVLDTEIDALLVEAQLIKNYQPQFNLRLKDDKSPAYIFITKDIFPKIKITRLNQIPNGIPQKNIFGPFKSSYIAYKIVRYTRSIVPFCSASDKSIKNHQACFYYHLDLCPGICLGKISKSTYLNHIHKISLFLKGQKKQVITKLTAEIKTLIKEKNFEQAQINKLQIQLLSQKASDSNLENDLPILSDDKSFEALKTIRLLLKKFYSLPPTYKLNRIEGYDISNTQGTNATGSMVVFINAKKDTSLYRRFKINSKFTPDDPHMIGEVLKRRSHHLEWGIPNLIIIDGGKTQLSSAIKNINWNIPIISIVKNPDRIMIKLNKKYYTIPLGNDLGSKLLTYVRDESHRFAKNYHLHLRTKSLTK
jgi:excinuclease ABC subunit C